MAASIFQGASIEHAPESEPSSSSRPDRTESTSRPASRAQARSPARAETAAERLTVAAIVRGVIKRHQEAGRSGTSNRALADRLGLDEREVRERLAGEANWPLHHIARLPRKIAVEVFDALAEHVDDDALAVPSRPLATHAMRVGAATGRLCDEVQHAESDGVVDEREERAIDLRAIEVVAEVTALRRDRIKRGPR